MADKFMWCIKRADGLLLTAYLKHTRREVISSFKSCHLVTWRTLQRDGFKAVQVRVTENLHG